MNKLNVGLVVGLLAVGFLWLRAHDASVAAHALAEARADSMRVVTAQKDSTYDYMDSTYAAALIKSQDSLAESIGRLSEVRRGSRKLADSLLKIEDLPPEVVVVIDTLIAEADACDEALGTCQGQILIWGQRMDSCNYAVGVCREQRQKYADMYMESVAANKPNLFKRLEISLPFMAAAVLLTLVVR